MNRTDTGNGNTPRYKMTAVMFLGMFPANVGVHHALKRFPELLELPALANAALITACVTVITMYVAMPILTRLLQKWLDPAPKPV